jgi:DNA recombination protein RmuC
MIYFFVAILGAALGGLVVWALTRARVAGLQATLGAGADLATTFKALSAQTVQESIDRLDIETRRREEQSREAIANLVRPIRESLEKVDVQSQNLENQRRQAYGSLSAQVRTLAESQEKLRSETGNLVTALRAPAARGRWGEMQLRRVVEMAGMLSHCDFTEQTSVTVEDRRLRPDLIVRLPGGKNVVVDAKVPLEAYLRAIEADDEETRNARLGDHVNQIRQHIQKLSLKSYWEQFQPSPEFVVLFIPGEAFYSAALQHDPALLEEGVDKRVIVATPTTLIAVLRAVAHGWHQETVAESARAVSELGREVYQRVATMGEHVFKLGQKLDGAVAAHNEMIGSLERRVLPAARKLADHGAGGTKEIAALEPIDRVAQTPQAPELTESPELEAAETLREVARTLDAA